MPAQQLLVHPRVVVETFRVCLADQEDQVAVTLRVPGQQDQVVVLSDGPIAAALATRHVDLAAQDRLDAGPLGPLVEVDRAERVAVIGDGHGLHAHFQKPGKKPIQPDGAVEQAVLSVEVQVGEIGHLDMTFADNSADFQAFHCGLGWRRCQAPKNPKYRHN